MVVMADDHLRAAEALTELRSVLHAVTARGESPHPIHGALAFVPASMNR